MTLTNNNTLPSNSQHADEVIRSLMRREGDTLERNFLIYRDIVRDLFIDLNLNAIKYTERKLIEVDKKTNSIQVPCNYLKMSSIAVIDDCNRMKTLIINPNITDDIIDVSIKKVCDCDCGCTGSLCGTIKNYEAIQEDVLEDMPGGGTQTFTKITRKILYSDGSVAVSYTYPIKKYEEGVWTSTELITDEEHLCKLEVSACGCVKDNDSNRKVLGDCINAESIENDCGCTCRVGSIDTLEYNFSEMGDRIVFPSNFQFDKVLLRCFVNLSVKDIRVPILAKPAFMAGLKFMATEFNDKVPQSRQDTYKTKYNNRKDLLAIDLAKCSLAEFYNKILPKRTMV